MQQVMEGKVREAREKNCIDLRQIVRCSLARRPSTAAPSLTPHAYRAWQTALTSDPTGQIQSHPLRRPRTKWNWLVNVTGTTGPTNRAVFVLVLSGAV